MRRHAYHLKLSAIVLLCTALLWLVMGSRPVLVIIVGIALAVIWVGPWQAQDDPRQGKWGILIGLAVLACVAGGVFYIMSISAGMGL